MSVILSLADLAGYVALLLWGTHMVTSGVQRGYGAVLRQGLGRLLRTGRSAFGAGLVVTLALQSSTATSLMGASFVAEGLIGLETGYLMMLGANVGTALVARALSFPVAAWAPVGILIGYLVFRRSHTDRARNLGRVAMGLGLMLLALHWLVATLDSWAAGPLAGTLLSDVASQPVLVVVGALALTWLCHSSVAVILLGSALMGHQGWPLSAQLAILIGANLGGALPPVLEAGSVEARRLPVGNLLVRSVGVVVLLILAPLGRFIPATWVQAPDFLVNLHVVFNGVLAALAFPFAAPVQRLLLRYLPSPVEPVSPGVPRYLDDANLAMPSLALASSEREVLRLTSLVEELLKTSLEAVRQGDEGLGRGIRAQTHEVSRLALSIRQYLARIAPLEGEDLRHSQANIRFLYDMEQVADLIGNMVRSAVAQRKTRAAFSDEEWSVIKTVHGDLMTSMHLSVAVFMRQDQKVARELIERKPALRLLENTTLEHRVTALRQGDPVASRPGDAYLATLRDFKQIHSHFTGVAYQVLENAGQLRSRLVDLVPHEADVHVVEPAVHQG
jgi:phosphate:Na+ symporter